MDNAEFFSPNNETQPAFGKALFAAQKAGVNVVAYTCKVLPDEITLDKPVEVKL